MSDVTEDVRAEWAAWCASRPPKVRAVAERFEPWKILRLKTTGQCAVLRSIDEPVDGSAITVKVHVWRAEFGLAVSDQLGMSWIVFGIDPHDLDVWPNATTAPEAEWAP